MSYETDQQQERLDAWMRSQDETLAELEAQGRFREYTDEEIQEIMARRKRGEKQCPAE